MSKVTALRFLLACCCLIIIGRSSVVRAQGGFVGPQRAPQPQFVLPPRGGGTSQPYLFAACSLPIATTSEAKITFLSLTGNAGVVLSNGINLLEDAASVRIDQQGVYFIHFSADAVTTAPPPVPSVQLYMNGVLWGPGDPGRAWHVSGSSLGGDQLIEVTTVPTILQFVATGYIGMSYGCKLVIQRIG
jgi:hypothetical protein